MTFDKKVRQSKKLGFAISESQHKHYSLKNLSQSKVFMSFFSLPCLVCAFFNAAKAKKSPLCRVTRFFLPACAGGYPLICFTCPLALKRGAYAPQTKWDSLIISVGKIKTGKHEHRRDTLYIYFTTERLFYQQFF